MGEQRTENLLEEAEFSLTQEGGGGRRLVERLPEGAWIASREPAEINEEDWPEVYEALRRRPLVTLQSLPGEGDNFRTLTLQRFSGSLSSLAAELKALAADEVQIFCATRGEEERLADLLRDAGAGAGIRIERGRVNQGFVFREIGTAVVPNHELFTRYRLRRATPPE